MRRTATVLMLSACLLAVAGPAFADVQRVRAAAGFTDYASSNDGCGVLVDEGDRGLEVRTWCDPHGRTWFTVRVRGVDGEVEGITLGHAGDCSGLGAVVDRATSTGVVVRVRESGRFDCAVRTVTVRSSG